jgi:ElaB/YqjD/DUF883 family membrane-anchored ribosome-binding protein
VHSNPLGKNKKGEAMLSQKRLERDLETLQSDLKVLINDAKEMGTQQLEKVDTESVARQAQETIRNIRSQLKSAGDKVESSIETHPYTAIGAALGLGFLLGKLGSLGKHSTP